MTFDQTLLVQGRKRLDTKHRGIPADQREDILQDSLIDLARVVERGGRVENPAAFLAVIIDRTAATAATKLTELRENEVPAGGFEELGAIERDREYAVVHAPAEPALSARDFDAAVRNLPKPQRDAFILCDLRGLTTYEAAAHLGVHQTTVSRDLSLARDLLKEEL